MIFKEVITEVSSQIWWQCYSLYLKSLTNPTSKHEGNHPKTHHNPTADKLQKKKRERESLKSNKSKTTHHMQEKMVGSMFDLLAEIINYSKHWNDTRVERQYIFKYTYIWQKSWPMSPYPAKLFLKNEGKIKTCLSNN